MVITSSSRTAVTPSTKGSQSFPASHSFTGPTSPQSHCLVPVKSSCNSYNVWQSDCHTAGPQYLLAELMRKASNALIISDDSPILLLLPWVSPPAQTYYHGLHVLLRSLQEPPKGLLASSPLQSTPRGSPI